MNKRYGFCGRLFDEYRAYNLDSSFVYAQRKEELAHRMDKLDYLQDLGVEVIYLNPILFLQVIISMTVRIMICRSTLRQDCRRL